MTNLEKLTKKVNERHPHAVMVPEEAAMGIASEAGEYLQLVRKWAYEEQPFDEGEAIVELADVLHYVELACHGHGITLDDLAGINVAKIEAREKGEMRLFDRVMHSVGKGMGLDEALDELESLIAVVSR